MLRQSRVPIVLLFAVVLLMGCQTTTPIQKAGSDGPTNTSQSSPGDPSSSSATPSAPPCPAPSPDTNHKIVLTAPCDGAKVPQRSFVEGVVADASANVSVVIHPMETADYWVQPSVTVREGGRWRVLCYFGETGPQHSGKLYEVMAIVMNAKEQLTEGQLFHKWPQSQSKSQVIEVVRQ